MTTLIYLETVYPACRLDTGAFSAWTINYESKHSSM